MEKLSFKLPCNNNFDELLIYFGFISVFLPYYITALFLIFACAYLLIKKRNTEWFKADNIPWLFAFIIYTAVIGLINKNFCGFFCSFAIFLMCYYSVYVKNIITAKIFENCLSISALLGLITSIIGIIDKIFFIIFKSGGQHRVTLYFFNCNYLATILAIVVIICGYKIILRKENIIFYLITALFCVIAMYFTGSMFVWIEVFVGMVYLLKYTRKNQLLSILLLALATVLIILYCVPSIIPRSGDFFKTIENRIEIWKISLEAIKSAPLFGRGFLSYMHILPNFPGGYFTTHSHNIFIELFIDFGIAGTSIVLVYIIKLVKRLSVCKNSQSRLYFSSLIISLLIGLVIHGTTDLTFLWLQTGLFYCLIICGLGPEEKLMNIRGFNK